MARVFIPQLPTRYDHALHQRVPTINVNAASRFGELVQLTVPGSSYDDAIQQINASTGQIDRDDFILAVGNVGLLTITILAAIKKNGKAQMLRWNGVDYEKEEIEQ